MCIRDSTHREYHDIRPATQDDVDSFNATKRQRFLVHMKEEKSKLGETLAWVNHVTDNFVESQRESMVTNMTYENRNAVSIYYNLFKNISEYNEFVERHSAEFSELEPLDLHQPRANLLEE